MFELKKGPTGRIQNLRQVLSAVSRADVLEAISNYSFEWTAPGGRFIGERPSPDFRARSEEDWRGGGDLAGAL